MKRNDLTAEALNRPCTVYISLQSPTAKRPQGYIGATIDYPAQPGENWRRGRDLPDGPWGPQTLNAIVKAIKAKMKEFALPVAVNTKVGRREA